MVPNGRLRQIGWLGGRESWNIAGGMLQVTSRIPAFSMCAWSYSNGNISLGTNRPTKWSCFSPHLLCVGFLFLVLNPFRSSSALLRLRCHTQSFTYNFVTHNLSHTTLSHTICHIQLCHTRHTHNFVTHNLSHTTSSHTQSFTYIQLCHTQSFKINFVTHTIFHIQRCHTHNF